MSGRWKLRKIRIMKTTVVGLLATGVDLATLAILIQGLDWTPRMANVPALVLGSLVQFFGNRNYVFHATEGPIVRQVVGFIIIEALSLGMIALTFHFAVEWLGLHYTFVRLACTSLVFFCFSYPLWHLNFLPWRRKTQN